MNNTDRKKNNKNMLWAAITAVVISSSILIIVMISLIMLSKGKKLLHTNDIDIYYNDKTNVITVYNNTDTQIDMNLYSDDDKVANLNIDKSVIKLKADKVKIIKVDIIKEDNTETYDLD